MKTLGVFIAASLFCIAAPSVKAGQGSDLRSKLMKALHMDKTEKPADVAVSTGTVPAAAQQAAAVAAAPAVTAAAAPSVETPAAPPDAKNSKTFALHKISKEEIGRQAVCPVTGAKVTVAANTPALDVKGKTYYFSSEAVKEKFGKDPGKYLAAKAKGLFKKKK